MAGMAGREVYIAIIGPADASGPQLDLARQVGAACADAGAVAVTGGLGGVMAAASEGVAEKGGISIGLLPGGDRGDANPYATIAIPTGLGELRNGLIIRSSDAVIAVGLSWGTLSEIALAMRSGKPVVHLDGGPIGVPGEQPERVESAAEAVRRALQLARTRSA